MTPEEIAKMHDEVARHLRSSARWLLFAAVMLTIAFVAQIVGVILR